MNKRTLTGRVLTFIGAGINIFAGVILIILAVAETWDASGTMSILVAMGIILMGINALPIILVNFNATIKAGFILGLVFGGLSIIFGNILSAGLLIGGGCSGLGTLKPLEHNISEADKAEDAALKGKLDQLDTKD